MGSPVTKRVLSNNLAKYSLLGSLRLLVREAKGPPFPSSLRRAVLFSNCRSLKASSLALLRRSTFDQVNDDDWSLRVCYRPSSLLSALPALGGTKLCKRLAPREAIPRSHLGLPRCPPLAAASLVHSAPDRHALVLVIPPRLTPPRESERWAEWCHCKDTVANHISKFKGAMRKKVRG